MTRRPEVAATLERIDQLRRGAAAGLAPAAAAVETITGKGEA